MRLIIARVAVTVLVLLGSGSELLAQSEIKPYNRRVVGGINANIKDYPWQVALRLAERDGIWCGGSIIADHWVLTAAHCFYRRGATRQISAAELKVKSGATNLHTEGTWADIDKIVIHENYKSAAEAAMRISNEVERIRALERIPSNVGDDIALIKLRSAPSGGRVIELAPANVSLRAAQAVEVSGWGDTSESGLPANILQSARMPLVDNADCNGGSSYAGSVKPSMLCAGEKGGGIDSCQGDSGGPLISRGSAGPILVGIVSWGEGCARKLKYGIYTRVSSYRNWIDNAVLSQK